MQKFDLSQLPFVQIFGLIDDDGNGAISASELVIFGKHFFQLDNVRRGLGSDFSPNLKWNLDTMLEHLEMYNTLRVVNFEEMDKDNDGMISEENVSTSFFQLKEVLASPRISSPVVASL